MRAARVQQAVHPRTQRVLAAQGADWSLLQKVVYTQQRRKEAEAPDHPGEWHSRRRPEAGQTRTNGPAAQAVVEHVAERTLLRMKLLQRNLAVTVHFRQMCGARCWTRDLPEEPLRVQQVA